MTASTTLSQGLGVTTSTTLSQGLGVVTSTTPSEGPGVTASTTPSQGLGVATSTTAGLVQPQYSATGTPAQEQSQQPVERGGPNSTSGVSSNPPLAEPLSHLLSPR